MWKAAEGNTVREVRQVNEDSVSIAWWCLFYRLEKKSNVCMNFTQTRKNHWEAKHAARRTRCVHCRAWNLVVAAATAVMSSWSLSSSSSLLLLSSINGTLDSKLPVRGQEATDRHIYKYIYEDRRSSQTRTHSLTETRWKTSNHLSKEQPYLVVPQIHRILKRNKKETMCKLILFV